MKNWFKKIVMGLSVVGLVAGLSACGPKTPEERQAKMVERISDKLDLTQEQVPYAERMVASMMKTREQLREHRKENIADIRTMVMSDQMDKAQVNAMIDQKTAVLQANRDDMIDSLIAFHGVLTPEQKEEIDEKLEDIQEHWMDKDKD